MSSGLYIHWPFCRHKCPYCTFVSFPGRESCMEPYARALRREMNVRFTGVFNNSPETVYVGGGTPSLAPSKLIRYAISDISVTQGTEFTVEANPESLSETWLNEVREAGVNRVSIGIQALDDGLLAGLGRLHSANQSRQAVQYTRAAGYENISVDLMFGIPGQTFSKWRDTLAGILDMGVQHISGYSLGVEEDTPFFERARQGGLDVPDAGEVSDMYFYMSETLRARGYRRYEISNFALPGFECRHNLGYWDFTPYLGIGASAHSFDGKKRWWNESNTECYMEKIFSGDDPAAESEEADSRMRAVEKLMLSLRKAEGIGIDDYLRLFPRSRSALLERVEILKGEGLLKETPERNLILTDQGIMIADEIFSELVPDREIEA
ncbi:MAG: radical SAM family heme chaperone HemW [Candidatus Latescibacterota bacterium]